MRSNKSDSGFIVKFLRNTVLILFFILFFSIIYNFRNREIPTESALMAEATASRAFKGVFIRNEQPITFSGNGTVSYNVSDGGKIGMGTVIARVYTDDEQISINRDIEELQSQLQILQKIQNPGTLESAQPSGLSASIEENFRNLIYCRDMKDYDTLKDDMDELLVQMSTYQIITSEVFDFNQEIEDITLKLSELQKKSVEPSEVITCDRPAYFASYCDGYEGILTKENAESITAQQISQINDDKNTPPNTVGKLIDDYNWYMAGVFDNSHKEYSAGDVVKLKFSSYASPVSAEIISVKEDGDPQHTILIMSCTQFNHELVQHRTENAELIAGTYRGLKVPRDTIRFKETEETVKDPSTGAESVITASSKGVYTLKGEQVEFKKIDVIYEGSDYVLSQVHEDDTDYLALYDDIMIEGVEQGE